MFRTGLVLLALLSSAGFVSASYAEDIDGVQEHGLVSRFPGQEIRWQHIENYMPFRVPVVSPVHSIVIRALIVLMPSST